MPVLPSDSVAVAEELLRLVKSLAHPAVDQESKYVYDTKIQIQSQCDELLRQVMGPLEFSIVLAESCHESQALHLVATLGIPDIIGDGTASVAELGARAGVDPRVLGVAMSCLLGRGYFQEVGEYGSRVYRNNHMSDALREDRPVNMKSAVCLTGDESFRAASRLLDAAKLSTQGAEGGQKKVTGAQLAFNFQGSIFKWMAEPEQAWRAARVGKAMQQNHHMANQAVAHDFDWNKLASPVVDCGGGIGSMEMRITPVAPDVKFTLLDLAPTVENAKKVWSKMPEHQASRVSFVAGDFMAPTLAETKIPQGQPTYMIAHVLHDWTDEEVLSILRKVRAAMLAPPDGESVKPSEQKLLICEMLLRQEASRFVRQSSMQLLALSNGITRTPSELCALVVEAGFEVKAVHHMRAIDSIIEAVPVV